MARLRLFAGLREAAGVSEADVPGRTVAEVLDNASARFGPAFADGLAAAAVWRNGDPATADEAVGGDDELALIPPVSGGATTIRSASGMQVGVVAVFAVAAAVAGWLGVAPLVVALVGLAALWVWDVADASLRRGVPVDLAPALVAVLAGGWFPYSRGTIGLALAAVVAVMAVLTWSVVNQPSRRLDRLAGTVLVALTAALSLGSLVMVRMGTDGRDLVTGFLIVVVAAGVVGAVVERLEVRGIDAATAGAAAAVLAAVIVGWTLGPSVVAMLVIGPILAVLLLAGRVIGALLRTGRISFLEPLPGSLAAVDPPVVAAMVLWVAFSTFA